MNAIIVDNKDNVATALRQIDKNEAISLEIEDQAFNIVVSQTIPVGHKFALKEILKGGPVIKYGEIIGLATQKIISGQLVHVHNVEGVKGRGDKSEFCRIS
jgi:altronate dehydratase small subunit